MFEFVLVLGCVMGIKLDAKMELNYELLDQTFVRFWLTCETVSWCAIGIGDSMPNADIMRLSMQDNIVQLDDMMSKPTSTYQVPDKDFQQDVVLEVGWHNGTHIYG